MKKRNSGEFQSFSSKNNTQIAVIGIGVNYPGAKTPLELWENVLARRQQFREMPDVRLPNNEYYDPAPTAPDKTYQNRAAVIEDYEFDWIKHKIPKQTYESTDIIHWMAVDTALSAITDAGYTPHTLPKETTGSVFGNTFSGEFTRSNMQRLRWPYVRKVLMASLEAKGFAHLFGQIEQTMEEYYKSVFAPVCEDTLAGGLPNTVAGRVCNYLDVQGGGYIVDGACSSSLLAVATACNYLNNHEMDMVITGGVDISLDTFELVGFSKTKALTQNEMNVYDKTGKGFLPGEGCGVAVLKRLEDAIRDNDQIYSIVNGWGISSDGAGGITAPKATGQSLALKRAYNKANFDPNNLNFIEGHGTGTTVGDRIELEGISLTLGDNNIENIRKIGVTSLKSILGHTKAASGIGAFIKTSIALNQRIIPPTAGIKDPNPIFDAQAKKIYPVMNGEILPVESLMHAGVSAMGFGGINCHVILQSGEKKNDKFKTELEEEKILASKQSTELFLFAAESVAELTEHLNRALNESKGISYAELSDYAAHHNSRLSQKGLFAAALIAKTPFDFQDKLILAIEKCQVLNTEKNERLVFENGSIVIAYRKKDVKIGAIFTGQGSQQINTIRHLAKRFDWANNLVKKATNIISEVSDSNIQDLLFRPTEKALDKDILKEWKKELTQTNFAQPAITLSSLVWFNYLKRLGIDFNAFTGHSLGELTAFHAAGALTEDELLEFAAMRGKIMAENGSGNMASLFCDREAAEQLISDVIEYVMIANINAPDQIVISGETESIHFVIKKAEQMNIGAVELKVSAAFHSHLMKPATKLISDISLLNKTLNGPTATLISSMNGEAVEKGIKLNDYFSKQVVSEVNFVKAIQNMAVECDVFVEIGPGKILTNLIQRILPNTLCLPVESSAGNDEDLNSLLANLFILGVDINIEEIYKDRFIRKFKPAYEKTFIMNPLERPFNIDQSAIEQVSTSGSTSEIGNIMDQLGISMSEAGEYLNARSEFIKDVIRSDMKHFNGATLTNNPSVKVAKTANNKAEIQAIDETDLAGSIKKLVFAKIEKMTGFPESGFTMQSKLLDDFNLDSIKAGTFIVELLKEINSAGKLEPVKYANASLEEIIDDIVAIAKTQVNETSKLVVETISTETSIRTKLFELVEEKTGFPIDRIDENWRLLEDINLDSIKAGLLIGDISKEFNIQGKLEPIKFANASLLEIKNAVLNLVGETVSTETSIRTKLVELVEEKTGFPIDRIDENWRLLEDINLDSIKAGLLIGDISKEFNIQGKLEPIKFANASLLEIKNAVLNLVGESKRAETGQSKPTTEKWVRSFVAHLEEEPLHISNTEAQTYWSKKRLGIHYLSDDQAKADSISQLLNDKVKSIELINSQQASNADPAAFDALLVIMPERKNLKEEDVDWWIEYYVSIATSPILKFNTDIDVTVVQFGDGYFQRNGISHGKNYNVIAGASFSSSIHLEKPRFNTRMIEFQSETSFEKIAETILLESVTNKHFDIAAYDAEGTRRKLLNTLTPNRSTSRELEIAEDEVILITGGAKGITSECGIALSKQFKCKYALIGSSQLKESSPVHGTIARYNENAVETRYFSCDTSNKEKMMETIGTIEKEMGNVAVVFHGAGLNHPCRLDLLEPEKVKKEISPKILGAIYLMEAFESKPPKLFIGISSILGVTGMRGNSTYCLSNETLDLMLRDFSARHPVTHTVTNAYSIWDTIGMGVKMGSIDALEQLGIGSIPVDGGISEFMHSINNTYDDQQVVITSNIYGIDTWRNIMPHKPKASRYLEQVMVFEPGVELIVRAKLNIQKDLYLIDHNYNGSYLFPTVFGIEAMGQAVALATGRQQLNGVRIENISLRKPIVVSGNSDLEIELKAIVSNPSDGEVKVKVGISTEHSNFAEDHFKAEFCLENTAIKGTEAPNVGEKLDIVPKVDLYSWLLFQGPLFQNIKELYSIGPNEAVFSTLDSEENHSRCFGKGISNEFILGSPLVRDTLLQAGQFLFTDKRYLPVEIKRWTINNSSYNIASKEIAKCELAKIEGNEANCNVSAFDDQNNAVEFIEGYVVKALEDTPGFPSQEEMTNMNNVYSKHFMAKLEETSGLINNSTMRTQLYRIENIGSMDKEVRRLIEKDLVTTFIDSLKDETIIDTKLKWNSEGKPSFEGIDELGISISHSEHFLLFTIGKSPEGCDIEPIEERESEVWENLLNEHFFNIVGHLQDDGEDLNTAATRLWTVKEAMFKATNDSNVQVYLYKKDKDCVLFKLKHMEKDYHVITFPVTLLQQYTQMVSFIVPVESANLPEQGAKKNIVIEKEV